MRLSLYRLALLLAFLGTLPLLPLAHAQVVPGQTNPDPAFIPVWQVWWTVKGQTVFYSEATTQAKAVEVANALALFPEKPKTEIRGPFMRPVGTTPLFPIIFVRESVKDGLITGKVSAQGWDLGTYYENDKLAIKAGVYTGILQKDNKTSIVLGPDGQLGTKGDFLIQLPVPKREDIFLIYGDQVAQSNGSIMLGAPVTKGGISFAPDAYKTMRLLFYEQNNTPMLTPNKTITVEIRDNIVRDKNTQPQPDQPR
jgi:hypothetical protein